MQNNLLNFLNKLEIANIEYVSWKNNHEIELAINGKSDLDIYVPLKHQKKFLELAKSSNWISVVNPVAIYPYVEHFFFVSESGPTYHLHVYYKIVTGESWIKEYDLPIGDFLIKNKSYTKGIFALEKRAQAYIFALRHLLKSSSISSRVLYLRDIESYKSEWFLCNYNVKDLLNYGPISLNKSLNSSGLSSNFNLSNFFNSFKFRLSLIRHLRLNYLLLPFYRVISFFNRLLNKLIFHRKKVLGHKGVVIAISGVDGSGKSSMVHAVEVCFSGFLQVKRLSLGKPQGKLLEFVRRLVSRKDKKVNLQPKEKSSRNTSFIKSFSLLVLALLRLLEAWKSQYYVKKGYFVLVDRWPTREFGKMDGPKVISSSSSFNPVTIISKLEKIIYSIIPEADICIFLDVSVETAVKRNSMRLKDDKETDSEIYDRHKENNKNNPIAKKIIKFDNNGQLQNKRKELIYLICNELANTSIDY